MHLTVAICTWNRAAMLRRTLEQATRLVIPPGVTWELVVVDNACTDDTRAVLAELADRLPLVVVSEPEPGLSHARNAAVRAATGEVILWTDDDVLVEPTWLSAYAEAIREHPCADLYGGPVTPLFEGDPPAWLLASLDCIHGAFAAVDLGDAPHALSPDRLPYGANMAVRRSAYERLRYRADLGRRPGSMLGAEELALGHELLTRGGTGRWVPGARVRHVISRDRQSVAYLRDYYHGTGQVLARLHDAPGRRFLGRPLWLWRQAVEYEVRFRVKRWSGARRGWIEDLKLASIARGQLRDMRPRRG